MANLIVVCGASGVGKSTFSRWLSKQLSCRLLSVDSVKELIYEFSGFNNKEEKTRLKNVSFKLFYLLLKEYRNLSDTVIIEYPFGDKHIERIKAVYSDVDDKIVTVRFECDIKTSYERAVQRDKTDDTRSITHWALKYPLDEGYKALGGKISYTVYKECIESQGTLNFCVGSLVNVDANHLNNINYEDILKDIAKNLTKEGN